MTEVKDIKRFLLRALARTDGLPMPESSLIQAAKDALVPRPLLSDIEQAKRELEADGFTQGTRDELDGSVTWTLTTKGAHKAKQLG